MDEARLRALRAELEGVDEAEEPVLRMHVYGDETGDEGYLTGNRAGLLRFARACVDAALSPNVVARDVIEAVSPDPAAREQGTTPLFDGATQFTIVGVACEEPLTRALPPAPPSSTFFTRHAGPIVLAGVLGCLTVLLIGLGTVVGWFIR